MEFIIFSCSLLIATILFFINKKGKNINVDLIIKVISIIYFLIAFIRLFLPDDFILVINKAYDYGRYFDSTDIYTSIIRWGYEASLLLIPIVVFFPNNMYLRRIITFYCLPLLILNVFHYDNYMHYYLTRETLHVRFNDPFGVGNLSDNFRRIQFILEFGLALVVELYLAFNLKVYKCNKKELLKTLGLLFAIIVISIPIYIPQSLFGYGNIKLTGFSLQNYIWIVTMIIITFLIYFIFRFQSKENRYIVCVFLSLTLFVLYNTFYMTGVTISRLPFQLCNLGTYLVLLSLLLKSQKLFNFIFIANILGTVIAILVPDASSWKGMFSFFDFHFMYEHMLLFILPILIVSLRVFERPNIKGLKHGLIGFTIYFIFCWGTGTYLNSISNKTNAIVNYFYIFKTDVLDALPFLAFTRRVFVKVGVFTIYPIYQFVIYLLYCFGCVGVYYVSTKMYAIADDHKKLRISRIKEWEEKTGLISTKNLTYQPELCLDKGVYLYKSYIKRFNDILNIKEKISVNDYWKGILISSIHYLILLLLKIVSYFIFKDMGNFDIVNITLDIIIIIYFAVNFIPFITLTIKRLNDIGFNYKKIWISIIPVIGSVYLLHHLTKKQEVYGNA